MIESRKNFDLLYEMTDSYRKKCSEEVLREFLADPRHLMLVEGKDVGLATFEYPGVYTIHWFFEARGRKAINQARAMLGYLFKNTDAKAVRGLVDVDLRASAWAARQVGCKSLGKITSPTGEYELFCMTKDDFYKDELNG